MTDADAEQLEDLAREALDSGEEKAALAQILPAVENTRSARLWQFAGLLQRALDQHEDALESFSAAARLAPDDAGIANGLARVALEAGLDAVVMFERAARLAPAGGPVLLGLVAAMLATGRGLEAEALLDALLQRSPLWIEGHQQLAQLRSMLGKCDQAHASVERAIEAEPNDENLWATLLNLTLSGKDYGALDAAVERARRGGLPASLLTPFEAISASEGGQEERATALFERLPPTQLQEIAVWNVRHLLRMRRISDAATLIDRELASARAVQFWPYASIAWRMAKDPRYEWLEAGGKLVRTFDLVSELPPIGQLADVLRSLHVNGGEYLDQSVRGGTQTDGPLLSRINPAIKQLRGAIVHAVEQYIAALPSADSAHPTLRERRDRAVRFSGSWSVRLQGAGHHVPHVHPQGWISSALYIALPNLADDDDPHAGWLELGRPPEELGTNLPPTQLIEPLTGKLVLFPSWMWHGTVPFKNGERLTVAFDVKPPIRRPGS